VSNISQLPQQLLSQPGIQQMFSSVSAAMDQIFHSPALSQLTCSAPSVSSHVSTPIPPSRNTQSVQIATAPVTIPVPTPVSETRFVEVPCQASPKPYPFPNQLHQLLEMGFSSSNRTLELLKQFNGDVDLVILALIEDESQDL